MNKHSFLKNGVLIIGCGLIGTSIALALRKQDASVYLQDISPAAMKLAVAYGAGEIYDQQKLDLVIVCVPPDSVADAVVQSLAKYPEAIVCDVASVKLNILKQLKSLSSNTEMLKRYVGTHPMAGRENGGVINARSDIFIARPWVICAEPETSLEAVTLMQQLIIALGSQIVQLDSKSHDQAVATVSHLPQIISSTLAKQLNYSAEEHLNLAGGGLRDTTRIAASSAQLWAEIISANAGPIAAHLDKVIADLQLLHEAVKTLQHENSGDAHPANIIKENQALKLIAEYISQGNSGVTRMPGKHGAKQLFDTITVVLEDTPGTLARLLNDLGNCGVNLEDLRLEHSPGAQIGFAELSITPSKSKKALNSLSELGWRVLEKGN